MKYGLDVSTVGKYSHPATLADLAAEAEQAGWDGFFIWDVVFAENQPNLPVADPWIALAAIAIKTHRMRIGALLTPLARRHPWQVAREAVSLDHLSNGRLIFGVGLGYQSLEFTPFGEPADPKIRAEKLDESLDILTGLWRGGPFNFQGKHYQVNVERFLPTPVQSPRIPIWVGGYWPNHKPFQRAARWDGVYPGSQKADGADLTLEDFRDLVAYVKVQRERPKPFDVAVAGVTSSVPEEWAEVVQPYVEAGATWWIEVVNDWIGSFEEMRERIRSGPPKLQI